MCELYGLWHHDLVLDAQRIIGLLAEPQRLKVVAALSLGSTTANQVVSATGVELRDVLDALGRLTNSGLVEQSGEEFLLLEAAFKMAAREAAPKDGASSFPDEPAEKQRILDQCLRDGRLIHMPSTRSKRLVLLEEIAQRFEPGGRYKERQVNASLSQVDADTATLRRYLVDNGFLDRGDSEYWRSGGTVR